MTASQQTQATLCALLIVVAVVACSERTQDVETELTQAEPTAAGSSSRSERDAMYDRYQEFPSYVEGGSIEHHWMDDGSSFWYAENAPANTVIYKLDPQANMKTPLFDTGRIRQALIPLMTEEPPYQGLPFDDFSFLGPGESTVEFTIAGRAFILELDTYAIRPGPDVLEVNQDRVEPRTFSGPRGFGDQLEQPSPDGRWLAGVEDHDLRLRSTNGTGELRLTLDGIEDYEWGHDLWNQWIAWSPDSQKLISARVDLREYPKIPIVDYLGPREKIDWTHEFNPLAGQSIPQTELFIFDVSSRRSIPVDTGDGPHYFLHSGPGWSLDTSEQLFLKMSRDYKKLELMAVNVETGTSRVVLTETQETFLVGFETQLLPRLFTSLGDGKEFVWMSERDGWRHLYLYRIDGTLVTRLTNGSFPVVEVIAVDDEDGWVYFTAHGDQQRPYDTHLYRVRMDGTDFSQLTEAAGQHEIQFAPSRRFFIDTHSSVSRPPVVELRRADGSLLQVLAKADTSGLAQLQWRAPEEFVVKAADGKTDLWGVLFKPYDFDPGKKYPVIDVIYGASNSSVVPKSFTDYPAYYGQAPALAQLGFITFIVDARGTPERSKAFQDVVYGNFGRYEIPDHVATLTQLGDARPYMDLSRVGIMGQSMGGYFTTRALFLAPDVYHVGVASAPALSVERETDLGSPESNEAAYRYASNLEFVDGLEGKLLLIHGTSDPEAHFQNTMKLADALIRAGKPYDFLVMPGQAHSLWRGEHAAYWREAIRNYFEEHLRPAERMD